MGDDAMQSLLIEQQHALAQQPVLFSLDRQTEEKLTLEGRYTAERLWRDRPEVYRSVVTMLAEKRSIRAIKKACQLHHETIRAVATRERISIDTEKERIIEDLRTAASVGADRLVEVMETIKAEYLGTALGITIDKLLLLSGEATARIETTTVQADAPRTWDDWLGRMKQAKGQEITGLVVGDGGQMGVVARPAAVHVLGDAADLGSGALQRRDGCPTGVATEMAAGTGVARGGEGVAPSDQGGVPSTG